MGNYISFDRKQAAGFSRALNKQREREARAAEERSIWNELAAEQLAKDRERVAASESKPSKAPKPKLPEPTARERGLAALERAKTLAEEHTIAEIAELRRKAALHQSGGDCHRSIKLFGGRPRHVANGGCNCHVPLAAMRNAGSCNPAIQE